MKNHKLYIFSITAINLNEKFYMKWICQNEIAILFNSLKSQVY